MLLSRLILTVITPSERLRCFLRLLIYLIYVIMIVFVDVQRGCRSREHRNLPGGVLASVRPQNTTLAYNTSILYRRPIIASSSSSSRKSVLDERRGSESDKCGHKWRHVQAVMAYYQALRKIKRFDNADGNAASMSILWLFVWLPSVLPSSVYKTTGMVFNHSILCVFGIVLDHLGLSYHLGSKRILLLHHC